MIQTYETHLFKVGDNVIYPSHGIGQITGEEAQVIAGIEMIMYVIIFARDKMIVRVPKARAIKTGLRHLSSRDQINTALQVLESRACRQKGMWNKKAKKYKEKIESGAVDLIAEVIRDLHREDTSNDRSCSEKAMYDRAMERLVSEYSAAMEIDSESAKNKILSVLSYKICG